NGHNHRKHNRQQPDGGFSKKRTPKADRDHGRDVVSACKRMNKTRSKPPAGAGLLMGSSVKRKKDDQQEDEQNRRRRAMGLLSWGQCHAKPGIEKLNARAENQMRPSNEMTIETMFLTLWPWGDWTSQTEAGSNATAIPSWAASTPTLNVSNERIMP